MKNRWANHRYLIINRWEGADGETYFAMRCRNSWHHLYCSDIIVPRSKFWPKLKTRFVFTIDLRNP